MSSLLRVLSSTVILLMAVACAGAVSTLRTKGKPTGQGPVKLQIHNASDTALNNLYMARTEDLRAAREAGTEPGSPGEADLWGNDLLDRALAPGESLDVPDVAPGRWDVRALDRDGRDQHVAGLNLRAGGRYVLELNEGSWRLPR